VRLLQGDLLAPLPEPVDMLTANLPYVGTDEIPDIPPDVLDYEPHLALFSGPHGLHLLQRFCQEALQFNILKPGAVMLLEIGYRQREAVTHLLNDSFPNATITSKQDYAGWNRVIRVET
jgi:release factor glutamine methyltransferase